MAVQIIEKEKRPERAPENKAGELVVLSAAQIDPHLADPRDFVVLEPGEEIAAPVGHGQCGRNQREYATLLKKSAEDRGKSKFRGKR